MNPQTTLPSAASGADVRLVDLTAQHSAAMHRWITDPRVAEPFLFAKAPPFSEHEIWLAQALRDARQKLFAVLDAQDRHVGIVGFKDIDSRGKTAEFFVYVGPEFQNRGIGRAATQKGLSAAFLQMALDSVYLNVAKKNGAALRIYVDLGFRDDPSNAPDEAFANAKAAVRRMRLERAACRLPSVQAPRVALMQPMFLPWLGYYELLDTVDIFVFLDDFQFSRQGWGHRNRLFLSPGRVGLVSLPIRHPKDIDATFLEIEEADADRWRRKFLASIQQTYGRAPEYGVVRSMLEEWLSQSYSCIADLMFAWLQLMACRLGSRTRIVRSAELDCRANRRSWRVASILEAVGAGSYYAAHNSFGYMAVDAVFPRADLPVFFQHHTPVPYLQLGSPFVPYLSALDAIFMLPPEELRSTLKGTAFWLDWEARRSLAAADASVASLDE